MIILKHIEKVYPSSDQCATEMRVIAGSAGSTSPRPNDGKAFSKQAAFLRAYVVWPSGSFSSGA